MRSQRKRHLFLGLGLIVALVLAVVLPATASAVPTLTGESLSGASASGNSPVCSGSTFSVSGTATAPYPGTFTESGTFSAISFTFSSTFTITAGTTTVTGSKTAPPSQSFSSQCGPTFVNTVVRRISYTATIHAPSGNFHDQGTSDVDVSITGSAATLTETYTSSLAEPVLIVPTSKDQCKNNGWKNFPQFKNQGECVSFVERQPRT
jgi:hypothetical protein